MTTPYNPPVLMRTGPGKVLTVDPEDFTSAGRGIPVWKPIGEASDSLNSVMWIEKIDGLRIPVARYQESAMLYPVGPAEFTDAENQNSARLEIIREAYRSAMQVADYPVAQELRERLEREADEMNRMKQREVQIKQESSIYMYPRKPYTFLNDDAW